MPPQILRDSKQERVLLPKRSALKWSKPEPVCGISVVKREIAVVFTTAISILVDPIGIEPTTLRMRTERSRNVVSFLPTDCGVWFDENAGRGADARNTIPQFFNKEGVDSKLICGED